MPLSCLPLALQFAVTVQDLPAISDVAEIVGLLRPEKFSGTPQPSAICANLGSSSYHDIASRIGMPYPGTELI